MIEPLSPRDRVFVLTGAGISAESGLPTFRGTGGISTPTHAKEARVGDPGTWRGYRAQDIATPEAFRANPEMVWQFYSERRKRHLTVTANAAHFALAELEQRLGERFFLCTQNVDSLHEQAGSRRILHMHGRLMQTRCSRDGCHTKPFDDERLYTSMAEIPTCEKCGALLRPHVCWFGEVPYLMDHIFAELRTCTVVLTVGTSGVVEPAASLVRIAKGHGARTIYVGAEEPANSTFFDHVVLGKAGEVLPELTRHLAR